MTGQSNDGCPKEDHPPALQPLHKEMAKCLLYWGMRFPGIPLLIAKKDISEAFKWVWLALQDISLFAADIPGAEFRVKGMITAVYLVLTFGWTGLGEWMVFA
jgi:hypothetical protein